jgi:hypothetical protein
MGEHLGSILGVKSMLSRLVYMSDAAADFKTDEVSEILDRSRKNNAAVGISGLLIFHERRFFQILEGSASTIKTCFARIMHDKRHVKQIILESGPAKARAFGQWRMAYARIEDLPAENRNAVFSIYDMVPRNSEERGNDEAVRLRVRDFLASYERLKTAS